MQSRACLVVTLSVALAWPAAPSPAVTPPPVAEPPPPEPVLHEYVPTQAERQSLLAFVRETGAGKLPPGFHQASKSFPRPTSGLARRRGEQMLEPSDRRTQRERMARPDRNTRHDGRLRYHAVYNPSVVPFKRGSALDAVTASFVLVAKDTTERQVRLSRFSGSPDRTLFWGSVLLRAHLGEHIPLPSVAPDMEIHGYETVPKGLVVTFFKDGADNFSVALRRPHGRTRLPIVGNGVRLHYLVSAPNRYFSHAVAPDLRLSDVPPRLRPVVPARVMAVARRMHRRLGLDRGAPLATLVDRLVAYFRAFEEGQLAVHLGTTYEDLTVSQRGVCRHRSYAFVITALALGLPARYVSNEAHAFVEIWVPRAGWVRIDLGGAADELNVLGGQGRAVHRPVEDPFPKPPAYANSYSRLAGNVTGLSSHQRQGPIPRSGHGAHRRRDDSAPGAGSLPGPTHALATPVLPAVEQVQSSGLRGAPLTVRGRVTHAVTRAPLGARLVEILLQKPGSKDLTVLGETSTRADGSFVLHTTVPLSARVGTYLVLAHCPADRTHEAAWSTGR